jgi:GGDEF domain-containing protein
MFSHATPRRSSASRSVDLFKNINDTHGHLLGDKVLRAIAQILRACIRGGDVSARIGGDEFAVLLPETPLTGAVAVAQKIRTAIAKLRLKRIAVVQSHEASRVVYPAVRAHTSGPYACLDPGVSPAAQSQAQLAPVLRRRAELSTMHRLKKSCFHENRVSAQFCNPGSKGKGRALVDLKTAEHDLRGPGGLKGSVQRDRSSGKTNWRRDLASLTTSIRIVT